MNAPTEKQGNVYHIPAHLPFAETLAAALYQAHGKDPLALSNITILLPTRRSCRTLREAFLRVSAGKPLLLPRLKPIVDLESVQEYFPPAISPLRRVLLLSQLILSAAPSLSGRENLSGEQAVKLAMALARFMDQVQTERLSFENLERLVPEEFAAHWQITLDFMKIVTDSWPAILEQENSIDIATRRNLTLKAAADSLQDVRPVMVAGVTGSIPVVMDLIKQITTLEHGSLILPGLDKLMDEENWNNLQESHPQYALKMLLDHLGRTRTEVKPFLPTETPQRAVLLSEMMSPGGIPFTPEALKNMHHIHATSEQEEADIIALIMRQTLETPAKTAALVTPNRTLARRVTASLQRWGIEINDSGGTSLKETPVGIWLRLVAKIASTYCPPVLLLEFLKHKLAAAGLKRAEFRGLVRQLELHHLRDIAPSSDWKTLAEESSGELRDLLLSLAATLAPLQNALQNKKSLEALITCHIETAEALAATDTLTGIERLWRKDDGEAAASFMQQFLESAQGLTLPDKNPDVFYIALLEQLMNDQVVRPHYGQHPRLFIWGVLEARLQQADTIILGGLNEGSWPASSSASPWMSVPMQKDFGLPGNSYKTGLAAHDFMQLLHTNEVFLTRTTRSKGAATVPSRWLQRLETTLKRAGLPLPLAPHWNHLAKQIDQPEQIIPCHRPAPKPPLSARPRKLSVTKIETWMRDPYSLYASHILKLKPLTEIDADIDQAEKGRFMHQILEEFIRQYPEVLPNDAQGVLEELAKKVLGRRLENPEIARFWWPKFQNIAAWFLRIEQNRRPEYRTIGTEISGYLSLNTAHEPFILTAKADRIDDYDNALIIIDYKTGGIPSKMDVMQGYAPQLPLEALIAQDGQFGDHIVGHPVSNLSYWVLSGKDPVEKLLNIPMEDLLKQTKDGLIKLIACFDDPETPYYATPHAAHAPRYNNYAHLARIKEWTSPS